jgi:tetratricopeptide (TPR) repeat protein
MSEVLSPQVLANEAQAAYQNGDYAAAARAYQVVAQSYTSLGERPAAAEMQNNASVAWLKADDAKAAFAAAQGTPAIFAEIGDARREGIAWGNLAAALDALHRVPEAIQAYENAIQQLEKCGEREYRAYVFKALSALKLQSGKQIEAMALMDAGLSEIPNLSGSQKLLRRLLAFWRRLLPH